MGTWGPAIFSDDMACDVREGFREFIADGMTPEEATNKLLEAHTDLDDVDERPVFWLALASTQWKCGRLLGRVKAEAIAVLDAGADLDKWREEASPRDVRKRERALAKLRGQQLTPQRAPTKIRKAFQDITEYKRGDAISYRLLSGRLVIMRVVEISEGDAVVDLCDWIGEETPVPQIIESLPRKFSDREHQEWEPVKHLLDDEWRHLNQGRFTVYRQSARDGHGGRATVVATDITIPWPENDGLRAIYFGGWKEFDSFLMRDFGIE